MCCQNAGPRMSLQCFCTQLVQNQCWCVMHGSALPEARDDRAAREASLPRHLRTQLVARDRALVEPDEVRDELVGRLREDRLGRVVLREPAALAEDRDPVADLDRLVDVVRDEDDRLPQLALQAEELVLQARADDRVDRAERLVHQHERRVRGKRAREADALALAAGELRREALRVRLVEADELEQLRRARLRPRARLAVAAAARRRCSPRR